MCARRPGAHRNRQRPHWKGMAVPGFSLKAIARWAKTCLAPGSTVFSDGLACSRGVTDVTIAGTAFVTSRLQSKR